MKNWIELCSDVNWADYHGMWARKARDGRWFVLQWVNMWDACGESDDLAQYSCEVKALDLNELTAGNLAEALRSCSFRTTHEGLVSDSGDLIGESQSELVMLECCIQYGLGAPLESFTGDKHPERVRAQARRFAEQCMRDAALLERQLDRPVNRIGSTAREYGRGDINSALYRGDDPEKQLMRKLHGIPEDPEFLRAVRGE